MAVWLLVESNWPMAADARADCCSALASETSLPAAPAWRPKYAPTKLPITPVIAPIAATTLLARVSGVVRIAKVMIVPI
jgi:hypothetical protein